jgi:hypothetical protein
MYFIQDCFICRPSDFTTSEDAGIESRTVATLSIGSQTLSDDNAVCANNLRHKGLHTFSFFTDQKVYYITFTGNCSEGYQTNVICSL